MGGVSPDVDGVLGRLLLPLRMRPAFGVRRTLLSLQRNQGDQHSSQHQSPIASSARGEALHSPDVCAVPCNGVAIFAISVVLAIPHGIFAVILIIAVF